VTRREPIHIPENPAEVQAFIKSVPKYAADIDDPSFLPLNELRDIQSRNLRHQLELVEAGRTHYRELLKREKLSINDISTVEDLQRLPITTKQDYLADPESFRLKLPEPTLYDTTYTTTYTSGTTTGTPTPFYNTAHDVMGLMYVMGQRGLKVSYLTPDDVVFSAFPLAPIPHIGFLNLPFNIAALGGVWGAACGGTPYPEFPLQRSTEEILDSIERLQPTVIMGIASYLRRLLRTAESEGRDFSSIQHVWAAGEPAAKGMRDDIRVRLQAMGGREIFVNNGYGFTEAQVQWCECHELGRCHNPDPSQFFMEVVDPDTHERLPDEEVGLLTITHLNRRGTVLLRYAIGDLVAISHGPCPWCGRTADQLMVKVGSTYASRTKDLLKIKGELVNPEAIKDRVVKVHGVVEYQIIVTKQDEDDPYSMDQLVIRLACEGRERAEIEREVAAVVYQATMVTPVVEFSEDFSDIFDPLTEFKAQRVIDKRPQG
jgi:phenylacetate-CoA ligase